MWKNKKDFCVQTCPWGTKWLFFWSDFSGKEGQGVELLFTAFVPMVLVCSVLGEFPTEPVTSEAHLYPHR